MFEASLLSSNLFKSCFSYQKQLTVQVLQWFFPLKIYICFRKIVSFNLSFYLLPTKTYCFAQGEKLWDMKICDGKRTGQMFFLISNQFSRMLSLWHDYLSGVTRLSSGIPLSACVVSFFRLWAIFCCCSRGRGCWGGVVRSRGNLMSVSACSRLLWPGSYF